MQTRSLDFQAAQTDAQRGALVVVTFWTPQGARVISKVGLTDAEVWVNPAALGDGTVPGDGTVLGGNQFLPVISREARMLSAGTITEDRGVLPLGGTDTYGQRRISAIEIHMRNDDDYFGKLLASDVLLSSKVSVAVGWRGERRDHYRTRSQHIVQEITLTREECIVSAEAA